VKLKTNLVLLAGVLAVISAGAAWWQWSGNRLAIVEETRPATPHLSAKAEVLRIRIAAAEARSQSRFTATAGLAELSRLLHANGFLEEATQCYAGLERLEPNEPRWFHRHATVLAGYGEVEPALGLWQRVIKLAPDYLPARLRAGDCLLKSNRPDEAAAMFSSVLKHDTTNPYALLGLSRIDLEAHRWEQARERLEKVVSQTNFQLGYDLIVSLYERLGQSDRAAAIRGSTKASGAYRDLPDPWMNELIDSCFDPYRLAVAAGVAANPQDTIRLLERAIEIAPDEVAYRFQLGCAAETQRNFPLARQYLERCTIMAPDLADGWAHLSALQAQQGDNAAAVRTVLTGLAHCPASPGLHLMRARALKDQGQIAEAINEYKISIHYRANEPDAYVELGNVLISAGREAEGIEQMRRALEADPGDPTALGVLTFAAITSGDEAEARRWFKRVNHQPRMPAAQIAGLHEIYRQTFGHDWIPAGAE
jgi:tetratricopeptide (TPR) repeat protein